VKSTPKHLLELIAPQDNDEERSVIQQINQGKERIRELSEDDLMKLLELRARSSTTLINGNQNDFQAWLEGVQYSQDINIEELSMETLLTLNNLICTENSEEKALRTESIQAGGVKFPDSIVVSELLEKTIFLTKQINEPLSKAAFLYQAVCSIHPFTNGNGRTARLITDQILIENDYAPLVFANPKYSFVVPTTENKLNHLTSLRRILESHQWLSEIFPKR